MRDQFGIVMFFLLCSFRVPFPLLFPALDGFRILHRLAQETAAC